MKIFVRIFLCGAVMWAAARGAAAFTTLPARTNDIPGFTYTPSPADWREIPIYQVMTDRFTDGDPLNNDNNPDADVNPFGAISIHGGDFEGLQQKLEYLRMLGMRAVWISPVVRNVNGIFHGYAALDFNQIDPHWGTLDDLRNLVDAAHAKGMYVFIDVVQNHMGDLITSTDFGYPAFDLNGYTLHWRNTTQQHAAPFNDLSRFYNYGNISDWNDPTQQVLGDFAGLDSLRTEDPLVRQDLITIYNALIAATDCDGFRVDTAKHVEMGFWETFLPAVYDYAASIGKTNFLVFGEIFDGADSTVASYTATNRFNSALYFPMRQTMEDVFVWDQPTSWLSDRFNALGLYDPVARDQLVNFLDNHDLPRELSADRLNGDTSRIKPALVFLYTSLEIPALYYGTEQGFDGGADPFDREDMFDGEFEFGPSLGDNFDYTHELFQLVRHLTLLRQAYPALTQGDLIQRWQAYSGPGLYVYSRVLGTNEVIVALNTSAASQDALFNGSGPNTAQAFGTRLINLFDTNETVLVGSGGGPSQITFSVPGRGFKVFVPEGSVQPLPPSVTVCLPAHGSAEVSRTSSIILDFDQPMQTGRVQNAFALTPAAPGTFSWSDQQRRMTFSPTAPLASNTAYAIVLEATARAASGLDMGAQFISSFDTGAALSNLKPLGNFVLDGTLDPGVSLLAQNNGIPLYGAYDATNGALYLATLDAGEGNDHFILIDTDLSGVPQPIPLWNKNGTTVSDGPGLADENDNDFTAWFGVNASASAKTGPNGGVLEGVINLVEQYGTVPTNLFIAVALYPTADGGALLAAYQVPPSQNLDSNIDTNEFLRYNPLTGSVILPETGDNATEVPLKSYFLDGQLSAQEAATLRMENNGQRLYADFNGKQLYVATQDAGEGSDHFIFVDDQPAPSTNPAPWAKTGRVAGMQNFLADENDSSFEGWFIQDAYAPEWPSATPVNNGGYLEGTLDPVAVFGRIPDKLYLAVGPYQTADGGSLYAPSQVPAGNGDVDIESNEFYVLDMSTFDTDGDGLSDLSEDLNANGVMDPGETGARVFDSDQDGLSDGAEVLAGSDPLDAQSRFESLINSVPSSPVRIEWSSLTGRLYSVYYTDRLDGTSVVWRATSVFQQPGTGSQMIYTETNLDLAPRYYRIQVLPSP